MSCPLMDFDAAQFKNLTLFPSIRLFRVNHRQLGSNEKQPQTFRFASG
jgi:hypothetical protein